MIHDISIPVASVATSKDLVKLEQRIFKCKAQLSERLTTAMLWLQYVKYVKATKLFCKPELCESNEAVL